jgi:hypothetical protein
MEDLMLSALRKYRVGFTIAHQYLFQLAPEVRHAVLGNTGTIICFQVGAEDAPYLSRELVGRFREEPAPKLGQLHDTRGAVSLSTMRKH